MASVKEIQIVTKREKGRCKDNRGTLRSMRLGSGKEDQ